MRALSIIISLLLCIAGFCQNRVVTTVDRQDGSRVLVKWYFRGLITAGGCNVYRQEKGKEDWIKMNKRTVEYKGTVITPQEKNGQLIPVV